MSRVKNIILSICGLDFSENEKLKEVNTFFPPEEGFVSASDPKLPKGWYGGTKYLEAFIAIGAFNHIDFPGLIDHLKTIDWPGPASVQVIYQDQEDTKFSIIDVIDKEWDHQ